jgi:hypothetical protein
MLRMLSWALAGFAVCGWTPTVRAQLFCGGCFGAPTTLSENVRDAHAVYLVRWMSHTPVDMDDEHVADSTTFEIVDVLKPGAPALDPRSGLVLDVQVEGRRGDLFMLYGHRDEDLALDAGGDTDSPHLQPELDWHASEPISEAVYRYLRHAPPPADLCGEEHAAARLKYFLKFLDDPDETIANDALAEFDQVPWNELARIADQFPRVRLRSRLREETISPAQREMFGLMLGMCGVPSDAPLLEGMLLEHGDEFWFDRRGLHVGYLLLAGERGMSFLDEAVLKQGPAYDCESLLAALVSLEEYFPETIPTERLRRSVRLLLDRPELAGTAVETLAALKDWDAQPAVARLIGSCGYEDPAVQLSILTFLQASAAATVEGNPTPAAAEARRVLAAAQQSDPELYQEFEENFGIIRGVDFTEEVP